MRLTCFSILALILAVNANYDVTLKHLKDREGFATIGYLPTTLSGVTIGVGIDLGQQTKAGLQAKGVSAAVITKVEKYLGYKSKAELDAKALTASSLVLTILEAEDITKPFIMDSYNVALPYAAKMDSKGLATLVSLRHWAGSLGCTNCKLSLLVGGIDTNYVWNAIKDKIGTNLQLKTAMEKTLPGKTVGTATYNRLQHEITYLI
jgi:hypothetical protein